MSFVDAVGLSYVICVGLSFIGVMIICFILSPDLNPDDDEEGDVVDIEWDLFRGSQVTMQYEVQNSTCPSSPK